MTTAREIMTGDPVIVSLDQSIREVANVLKDENIGSVIVCGDDRKLSGMLTDRDLAVGVVATGKDPDSTKVRDIVEPREVVTIGADDTVDVAMETMKQHAVRRLPVIDGTEVIGMVSQADLASHTGSSSVGDLVEQISEAPDNTGQSCC